MPMFNVTQKHINEGVSDCNACPVALAMLDAEPKAEFAWVGDNRLEIHMRDGTAIVAPMPIAVHEFAANFDAGEHVEPFSFDATFHAEATPDAS